MVVRVEENSGRIMCYHEAMRVVKTARGTQSVRARKRFLAKTSDGQNFRTDKLAVRSSFLFSTANFSVRNGSPYHFPVPRKERYRRKATSRDASGTRRSHRAS